MHWLHFSDFHFGRKDGAQKEAMASLTDFIRAELDRNPIKVDALFLVGDIAYSGQQIEYANFEKDFLNPLLKMPEIQSARVFAVPGNHDVECDAATPITWDGIRGRNQQIYFCENEEGRIFRKPRSAVFRHYWDFVQRNKIISPNPFECVSEFYPAPDFPFDILVVNTSFFCDKDEESDKPITPCPLSSLRERLHGIERKRPLVVLGHHPVRCFLKEHQKPFETLLLEKMAVYLHGHEHDPSVAVNVNGTVRTLGFGAAYLSPLGTGAHAPYRNSFASCRMMNQLCLTGFSWDYQNGRWDDATRSQFAICITQETFDGQSVLLNVPLLTKSLSDKASSVGLASIPRKTPQPQLILPISAPSERIWIRLLALSKNIIAHHRGESDCKIQSSREIDGKCELVTEQGDKRDLLICIPGPTHMLSAKEIESYNTRLDTEDYRSVTVLSFGKMSNDARDMYLRLKTRKPIEVLVNQELTAKWQRFLSMKQVEALATRDAGEVSANVLVDGENVHLLVLRSNEIGSFQIIDAAGRALPPADATVANFRESNPSFSKRPYDGEPAQTGELLKVMEFDETAYLKQCYTEYNAIKYAALANVGIRFSDFSLEDVYIDASACEVEGSISNRFDALLDDHLAAYPASEKLKTQIKQQFLNHVERQERHETSQAREFCQKYGAILVTGDPGSGKTCFVKSEVLAYSKRALPVSTRATISDDWHSLHIPVLVSLSQAAAEGDLESQGLLPIASRLLERRGFHFPNSKMQELLKQGRLALFFDGLDEVVSVEKRALVVQHINDLVSESLSLGNRVVVTSRPAAINVVNLLPTLRQLELQGLTQGEIRTLASRILTLNWAESGGDLVLDNKEPRASDNAIIKQLLEDCASKPGVARFATNPLLLTLLVMIYANSGAPSAKRHRIYEEAIKTLASVRGRQAGHTPVSVQDLREKLGAVALSVYRKESGFLPTKAEVTEIIRGVMAKQRGESVALPDAQKFIQKVAESTGLIAVSGTDARSDEFRIVTFMHHSFMEYFAAVGLSRELDHCDVASLVTQPRWIEILTLLAGVIGESADIAPVLARFVGDGSSFGDVDARLLIFALDCALECEVPSEAAVNLLSNSISRCIEKGPARTDPWVRSEIGDRLARLSAACGFAAFEPTITALIRSLEDDVSAAAISVASYACCAEPESHEILKALVESCARSNESVQCALCDAASRIEWARVPEVMEVLARCFNRGNRCKRAAFEAILAIPGSATKHWPEIINGLDDTEPSIRHLASRTAVRAGLDGDIAALNDARKDVVANALRYVGESPLDHDYAGSRVHVETVERLMKSGYLRDRLIGIQLIPAIEADAVSFHQKLMDLLDTSQDHQELTAVLRALRSSREARLLFSVADLKRISKLAEAGTADVRKASIQLLGCFGADIPAVKTLLDCDLSSMNASEFEAVFTALNRAQVHQEEVVTVIEAEILRRTREDVRLNASYVTEMCALLDAARCLGKNLRGEVSNKVRRLVQDYKQHDRVRRAALWAYAATAMPSKQVVEFLTGLFLSPPPVMIRELAQSLGVFAKNCRQSVEYVMACVESMSELRAAAVALHQRLSCREVTDDNEFMVTELRDGIQDLSQIIVTFEEFINPTQTKTADNTKQGGPR